MFHHSSAATITRAFLCAVPRRAVLTCCLHSRCSLEGCTSHTPFQWTPRDLTAQQARWHWWSGQQHNLTRTHGRHWVSQWVTGINVASYCTSTTSAEQSCTTSIASGFAETTNTAEDEVDFKSLVELEVEMYRQEGFTVPSEITPRHWQELLTCRSVISRKKYLTFLFKNEKKAENRKKKQEMNREKREEKERLRRENPVPDGGHIEYGLWRNSIFLKILQSSMTHFYNSRVMQAMLYGQPLVLDLDYDEHMASRERQNCAFQIQMLIGANRSHQDPYILELHNTSSSLDLMDRLERYVPPLYKPEFPLVINPGSYLEKYPREQLVYLTPHCQEELLTYDHNAVYIIGGFVDKSSGQPLALAKAKREGIRMQKLPLDRYLSWGIGNKALTLNQVVSIMLDFKLTGDWLHALRHVPCRKLQPKPQSQEARMKVLMKRMQSRRRP